MDAKRIICARKGTVLLDEWMQLNQEVKREERAGKQLSSKDATGKRFTHNAVEERVLNGRA